MATVLVVHDDPFSQRVLSKIVAQGGHGCLLAHNETEAWKNLRERGLVDLVVLDAEALNNKADVFLRSLREDPVFFGIPVVVYIGQAERTTIYRYAQQGVQAMLAKPFKGEALLEELNKAVKADWLTKLVEPESVAVARLGVPQSDYFTLLSAVSKSMDAAVADFRKKPPLNGDDERGKRFLKQMINHAADVGAPGLRVVAANLGKALAAVDEVTVRRNLTAIESLAAIMRRRVHEYLQVHDRKVIPVEAPPLDPVPVPTDYARLTTLRPLHAMGGHLGRLGRRTLPDEAEWSGHISMLRYEGALMELGEAIRRVALAPTAGREEVVRVLEEEQGLLDVFLAIAHRLGEFSDDVEMDAMMAVDRVGVDRALLIANCGKFIKASRVDSPLDLRLLRRHTVVLGILSYELATLLRLPDRHLAAAAGLGADGGHWLAALGEPLLYGLALAESAGGTVSAEEAEKRVLGATLRQISIQYMDTLRADESARQITRQRVRVPGQAVDKLTGHAVAVNLAEHLAWAALDTDEKVLVKAVEPLSQPSAPQWLLWEQAKLKLPLDIPELVSAFIPEARTAVWVADTMLLWADAATKPKK